MVIIYLFVILLFVIVNLSVHKNLLSPFLLFVLPQLLIYFILYFFDLGFNILTSEFLFYLMIFSSLFFLIDFTFSLNLTSRKSPQLQLRIFERSHKTLVFIFFISLMARYLVLFESIRTFGLGEIKGTNSGFLGHLGLLSPFISPYLFYLIIIKRRFIYILPILLLFLNLVLFESKYPIAIVIFQNILFFTYHTRVKFLNILLFILSGITLSLFSFILIYAIFPNFIYPGYISLELRIIFSIRHYIFYLFGPMIASQEFISLKFSGNSSILFIGVINIYRFLFTTDPLLDPVIKTFFSIGNGYSSNVGTFIGEVLYQSENLLNAFFYFSLIVIFVSFLETKKNNGNFFFTTSLLSSVIALSFFSNFIGVSGVYLALIYIITLEVFLYFINNKKRKYKFYA